MKILHIHGHHSASDHFTENFQRLFPGMNIVVKLSAIGNDVTVVKDGEKEQYSDWTTFAKNNDFSEISIVVVHYLDFQKERFIYKFIPERVPIVWWMYGGDLYDRLYLKGYKLYAPQTLHFVRRIPKNPIIYLRRKCFEWRQNRIDKIIWKRIVGVTPCLRPDYALACSLLGREVDLVDITPQGRIDGFPFANGNDICVGHSASLSSNHLYALDILKKVDTNGSNIVLPLSYTIQSESYRKAVKELYTQEYGNRAHFLFDYQDLDTYRRGFLNYKVAIYPCWRQEALANVSICFQLGVKVFLSKHNPCLEYYQGRGYYIYALEDIKSPDDLKPLTKEQQIKNKELYDIIYLERENLVIPNITNYFSKYV